MVIFKTEKEIAKIREASRIVAEVLDDFRRLIEPGVMTIDLDRHAEKKIRSYGAVPTFKGYSLKGSPPYPAATCISINEEVIHGIPSRRKLVEGDIVSIDCGVTYNGYIGDAACTYPVGIIEPEKENLLRTGRECLENAIKKAVAGKRLHDVSFAVQSLAEANGYGVLREYCGHGVGKYLHEDPPIPNTGVPGTGIPLKEGMTLAIEPMITMGDHRVRILSDNWTVVTIDGKPAAHFEHTVAITKNGTEILTKL